jgi:hypothetical protein
MSAAKTPSSVAFPWRVLVGWQQDQGFATEEEANEYAAEQAESRAGFEVRVYLLKRVYRAPKPEPLPASCYEVGL